MMGKIVRFERPNSYTPYYWYEDFRDLATTTPPKVLPSDGIHVIERKQNADRFRSTKITWPSDTELRMLIWAKPTVVVAELLGVSDAAIYKRCRRLGIERPPRGFQRGADIEHI